MDRADNYLGHVRFEFAELAAGEQRVVNAILIEPVCVTDRVAHAFLGAEAIEPAALVHDTLSRGAGLGDQCVVLRQRIAPSAGRAPAPGARRALGAAFCQ